MKDQTLNQKKNEDAYSEALKSLAQNIEVNPGFTDGLEKQLIGAHKPTNAGLFFSAFNRAMPTLGWIAALAVMILVLNLIIRSVAPPPVPAGQETSTVSPQETPSPIPTSEDITPVPDGNGYDWRGAKLYLAQPLPESPEVASVYQLKRDQQITPDEARALARRFGLPEEMYISYDYLFSVNDYYFTNGKQALEVYSNRRFNYVADLAKTRIVTELKPIGDAEPIIREFLSAHGFDFPIKIAPTEFFGGYSVEPLAPDGISIQYESFTFPPMLVKLDENGEVLSIDATLVDFDSTPLGTYGIISAQEALEYLLKDSEMGGKVDFFSASNQQPQEWFRSYPDNQPITIYGYVSSNLPVDPSKPPFITIDGVPATGNTAGLEQLDRSTFIHATGQYLIENGLRQFNVETWNTNIVEDYVEGTLRLDGDQIVLTSKDGSGKEYPLIDPPAGLPLNTNNPDSQLAVSGIIVNEEMHWTYIQFFENPSQMGGGGGSGGLGFYQLNLSGPPIPFPTPTVQSSAIGGNYVVKENDTLASIAANYDVSVEDLARANALPDTNLIYVGQVLFIPGLEYSTEQRVDNLRGFLSISIHKSAEGSQTTSYLVVVPDPSNQIVYELEGSNLSELDQYNGLPILVSGTTRNDASTPKLSIESYEIPFPDLHFQIVEGTQKVQDVEGQSAILFTTEAGQTYVELRANSGQLTDSIIGYKGDLIQHEAIIVPDETYGSYPVIRVFSSGIAISPKDGQALDLEITANQIPVYDDAANPEVPNTASPSLTIESVELEYFVNNPYYQVNDPNYERRSTYIQPVWHFQGRYENGATFDMMIQALKREFLSPQLSPGISPG